MVSARKIIDDLELSEAWFCSRRFKKARYTHGLRWAAAAQTPSQLKEYGPGDGPLLPPKTLHGSDERRDIRSMMVNKPMVIEDDGDVVVLAVEDSIVFGRVMRYEVSVTRSTNVVRFRIVRVGPTDSLLDAAPMVDVATLPGTGTIDLNAMLREGGPQNDEERAAYATELQCRISEDYRPVIEAAISKVTPQTRTR